MWLAVDVKTNRFVFEGKSSFKMVGLTFSSKLDWGSCIISIAKTTTKKIGALIHSMKFLSAEVAHVTMHEILLSCLGWCSYVMLGIFR